MAPAREGDVIGGMLAAAAANQVVEVWPDNWPAWRLFMQVSTQWTVGMAGPTGLRYEALYPLLDRFTETEDDWRSMFEDIHELERAALTAMHAN